MNKRILHFFVDEKVVTRAIYNYDSVFPGENRYIVIKPKEDYIPKHVKITHPDLSFVKYNSAHFNETVGDLRQYQYIIIHLLTWDMVDFVLQHPHPGYCWGIWGSDLYNEFLEYMGYDCYYDKKDALRFQGKMKLKHRLLLYPYQYVKHKLLVKRKLKALHEISYVSAVPGDLSLLQQYCPELTHLGLKRGPYYPVDVMVNNQLADEPLGSNIIIGNSAYAAGNHVEIFRLLSTLELKERKVITPLSYGDVAPYLIAKGREILGEHFVPITDFMPLDDYTKLMHSACTYIYNNYRQAAVGNIVVALYMGATVFLNSRNLLYTYFKRDLGCEIYLVDELPRLINYQLSLEEKEQNRKAILNRYSEEAIFNAIRESYNN